MRVSLVIGLCALIARIIASVAQVSVVTIFVLTPFRLDGLCLGGFLAIYARQPDGLRKLIRWITPTAMIAGALLLGTFLLNLFTDAGVDILRPLRTSLFFVLLAMLLLRALTAPPTTFISRFFRSKPMTFLGKYSYGLYVLHHFISYYLMTHRTEFVLANWLGSHFAAMMIQSLLGITASIIVSVLSYELFEKHFLSLKRLWSSEK